MNYLGNGVKLVGVHQEEAIQRNEIQDPIGHKDEQHILGNREESHVKALLTKPDPARVGARELK